MNSNESEVNFQSEWVRINLDTDWFLIRWMRIELIRIGSDTDIRMIQNSSDWLGMNSYPKLSPGYINKFINFLFPHFWDYFPQTASVQYLQFILASLSMFTSDIWHLILNKNIPFCIAEYSGLFYQQGQRIRGHLRAANSFIFFLIGNTTPGEKLYVFKISNTQINPF